MDWELVTKIAIPVFTLFVGAALNRYLERRPKLLSYLAYSSALNFRPIGSEAAPVLIHTHSIVVRNVGKSAANNVRLGHSVLPNFSVTPDIQHEVNRPANGSPEIIFPKLISEEQVTVTYLYFPPVTFQNVNTYTKSDEGFAKIVPVLLQPRISRPIQILSVILVLVGMITSLYFLVSLIRSFL